MRRTRRGRKTSTGFKRIYALKKSAVVCIFYTCGFGFLPFISIWFIFLLLSGCLMPCFSLCFIINKGWLSDHLLTYREISNEERIL